MKTQLKWQRSALLSNQIASGHTRMISERRQKLEERLEERKSRNCKLAGKPFYQESKSMRLGTGLEAMILEVWILIVSLEVLA